jgi:ankyrin repeat protein
MRAGDTPLIAATRHGSAADVAALLAAGVDVNEPKLSGGGETPLLIACWMGHTEVVTTLLAANADVNQANDKGATPLYIACEKGRTEIVTKLLAASADANQAGNGGLTPMAVACGHGQTEIVTALLAANADANKANNRDATPLYFACRKGHTEIVAKLLAANASVDQAMNNGCTPMLVACFEGHLDIVQLLSSYGASRTFTFPDAPPVAPPENAEDLATEEGYHNTAAWLVRSRLWSTPLHHLETLTPERALALLRAGADIHAAAEPGGPTPLSLAQDLAAAGRAAEGTAAFLVLEAAKPWSRKTHKYFPEGARARAVELWRWGFRFSRLPKFAGAEQAVFDLWMTIVMPHAVTRDYDFIRRLLTTL